MKTFVNFKYLPVLALVLGGGLAFASTAAGSKADTLADYEVQLETATFYQVGTPPSCGTGSAQACNISSPQAPDANGRISKTVSGVVVNDRRSN